MQQLTVNDQVRSYNVAKGILRSEVEKGNATAFVAELVPSTNVPESGTSIMLVKTTGGSGTSASYGRIVDTFYPTESSSKQVSTVALSTTMIPDSGDVSHICDMINALATYLTADGGAKLKQLYTGVHDSQSAT